jgi:pyruvate dehydrogenase E2 component (dihydrolipoamide acetyltransferase)
MATVVVMPQAGNTVESCVLTKWLVAVGEAVQAATPICEIETDKSSMEVPAGVDGTVLALLVPEDADVPVKDPIAVVGAPGETFDAPAGSEGRGAGGDDGEGGETDGEGGGTDGVADAAAQPAGGKAGGTDPGAVGKAGQGDRAASATPEATDAAPGGKGGRISPRARDLAAAEGIATQALTGSGPFGRVIERDVRAAMAAGPRLTSAALQMAGPHVPGASGTGLGGRITTADLRRDPTLGAPPRPTEATPSSPGTAPVGPDLAFPGPATDTPLKGVRAIIADRMMASLTHSAQVTYTTTAPAEALLGLRARFKGSDPDAGFAGVTIGDLVGYAIVQVLGRHPLMNSHLVDGVRREFAQVHLGVAVDTARGLLVPTIRGADSLTLRQFSTRSKELAAAAAGGGIDPDLLAGATFTVSNLGAFGIEAFTPVINLPQVGILGVGAITPHAAIGPDGSPAVSQRLTLSLTADHRVIDGADAARFLQDLVRAIGHIDLTAMG